MGSEKEFGNFAGNSFRRGAAFFSLPEEYISKPLSNLNHHICVYPLTHGIR